MPAHDVVLMTTHDIGRRLRSYGHPSVISPHVDSLAEDGVRFARAFCTAPQCSPSRASLATGRYPHNNGVMGLAHPGFDWELDPTVPHLAAVLSHAGLATRLFGGQHVSPPPAGRAENAIVVFTTDHGIAMPRAKCTLYDPGLEVALLMRWRAGGFQAGAVREELVSNIDVFPTLVDAADVKHPPGVQGRSLLPLLRG